MRAWCNLSTVFKGLGLAALAALVSAGVDVVGGLDAAAQAGAPTPKAIGLQEAATEGAERVRWLHNIVLWLIGGIVAFVLVMLGYIMIRFNAKANPVPSKNSHNTLLEVVWTAVPVMIVLGLIAIATEPLYFLDKTDKPDMTIKVVGNQWNWTYVYPDHGDFDFLSVPLTEEEAKAQGKPYLLAADAPLVVPAGKKIRVLVTASDVLHAFAVPSFGVKMDAVPGRINETWFEVKAPGTYYGQCSEICGKGHAFMPIEVKAVSPAEFDAWVLTKNPEYVQAPAANREATLTQTRAARAAQ